MHGNSILLLEISRILPREEADWHGLSFNEACHKQLVLERIEEGKGVVPMKEIYRSELLDKLKSGLMDDIDADLLFDDKPKESAIATVFKTLTTSMKR